MDYEYKGIGAVIPQVRDIRKEKVLYSWSLQIHVTAEYNWMQCRGKVQWANIHLIQPKHKEKGEDIYVVQCPSYADDD